MIVVDLEFTGFDYTKHGIWQIGALDLTNPSNTFIDECRIDDDDEATEEALRIVGKTEKELRDPSKQSQKALLEKFFKWVQTTNLKNIACQNTEDYGFLKSKALKYNLQLPFDIRIFDIHSIGALKHLQVKHELFIEEKDFETKVSGMGLRKILEFCGIPDSRMSLDEKGEVKREGSPHNALEDTKLEAEALSRLLYGKPLLKEFNRFPIPDYLKKE